MKTKPSSDGQGGQNVSVSVSHCLGSGSTSVGHSSVRVVAGGVDSRVEWGVSQLEVKLVLMSQVDPAEDECGQGQSEYHNEDCRACMAFILRLARCQGEGWPAGWISAVSLALLDVLLGATLPGAERATTGLGSLYSSGWICLCLWRRMALRGSVRLN